MKAKTLRWVKDGEWWLDYSRGDGRPNLVIGYHALSGAMAIDYLREAHGITFDITLTPYEREEGERKT